MATKNNTDVISAYTCTVSGNHAIFTIKFESGKVLEFTSEKYPANVVAELLAYGLKQKLIDSVASRSQKGWAEAEVSERLSNLDSSMRGGSFTSRAPGSALADQVVTAKTHLDTYLAKSASDKAILAEVGVTEASLRRTLTQLVNKLAKAAA